MGKKGLDLTDQKFGRLTAKKVVGRNKYGLLMWECVCSCINKNIKNVSSSDLVSRQVKSCGCLRGKVGLCKSKTKIKKTSKYKGVSWHKGRQKWRAQIYSKGKHYWLGHYDDEALAAKVYNAKAIEFFGENAWLNDV